jgi:hypothetical protein
LSATRSFICAVKKPDHEPLLRELNGDATIDDDALARHK